MNRHPNARASQRTALLRGRQTTRQQRTALVQLEGRSFLVEYTLARSSRRTIGFQIDGRGLTIAAPYWVALVEIESAVQEKARWILTKQDEWQAWEEARLAAAPRFVDGGQFNFLGRRLTLRLVPRPGRARNPEFELAETTLTVRGGQLDDPKWVERKVTDWIKGHALSLFRNRLDIFAERLGTGPSSWGLSSARSRWGSCNSDRRILLSWRLMHYPLHVIDYVIAHEVAHLKELNHSPRFWATVGRLLPGYEQARDELRRHADGAHPI